MTSLQSCDDVGPIDALSEDRRTVDRDASRRRLLSDADRARAWLLAYEVSLDELPDREIVWERARWTDLGAPRIAALCSRLLRERSEADLHIPNGAAARFLDALWRSADQAATLDLVWNEGLSLVEALRLQHWVGVPRRSAA